MLLCCRDKWSISPLNTKLCSLKVLFRLVQPSSLVFLHLPGISPRNLIHSFLRKFFAGSWPWSHPLITERSIVRALQPENAPPDWKLPKNPEVESLQGERTVFYARLYKKAERAIQCWLGVFYSQLQQPRCTVTQSDHFYSQLQLTAAMHCHPQWYTHPPPLVTPFLLAQNLSSKRIAPTDITCGRISMTTIVVIRSSRVKNAYLAHF